METEATAKRDAPPPPPTTTTTTADSAPGAVAPASTPARSASVGKNKGAAGAAGGADGASSSKRRCVSTACIACRRRKSKCDGNLPSCAACSSVYHTPCVYDPNSDHRRKGVYRKDVDTLRTRNTTLQTLIHAILAYDEDDAYELVRQIRSCDSLEEVAESVNAREKGVTRTQEGPAQSTSDDPSVFTDQFETELSGKMGELLLDGSRKFVGGTSNLVFLPPGSELYESSVSPDAQGLLGQPDGSISRWTRVTDNEQLISHLLTMYFTWHYPCFTTLSKDLFYRDYVRGVSSQYCSSLLVNVMLALGCHFTSWEGAREDPQDSATAGDHFFKEAKRLLLENDEHENARLCTVQALALMSVREAGCGREGKGWVYSGMSFRMAFDLGLNLDVSSLGSHTLSDEEIDARRITFWGCYLFDKCWSNYLGRLPQLSPANVNVSKFDIFPKEEAELWSPYTDSGVGHEHTQPSRIRAIALHVAKLCEISGDLLVYFYSPPSVDKPAARHTELKKLSEIHTRLEAWKKEVPKELEPKEGQLPQLLVMHMFYQLLLIHLYRPFLKYNKSNSPLPSHVSPRKLCTQAAAAISKLLRMYKRTYGFSQICNIVVYIAHTACTVHILNLPDKNAQRDIVHGLKSLEEMGESWLCARRTLRILDICASKWQVDLPSEAMTVLERTHAKWGSWGSWDQTSSPSSSDDSPTMVSARMHASTPSGYSSPSRPSAKRVQHPHVGHAQSASAHALDMASSIGPSAASIPGTYHDASATRRSLSTKLQRQQIALPEPTYLRPMASVSYPFPSFPVPPEDGWYHNPNPPPPPSDDQMRRMSNTNNTQQQQPQPQQEQQRQQRSSTSTATSSMTGIDPESLVEESRNWWSRDQSLAFGLEGWDPSWTGPHPAAAAAAAAAQQTAPGQTPTTTTAAATTNTAFPLSFPGSGPPQSSTGPPSDNVNVNVHHHVNGSRPGTDHLCNVPVGMSDLGHLGVGMGVVGVDVDVGAGVSTGPDSTHVNVPGYSDVMMRGPFQ